MRGLQRDGEVFLIFAVFRQVVLNHLGQQHDRLQVVVDVVGHAAHVAGQVEQLAPPGSVAISATTASLIAENCNLRQTGRLPSDGHDSADDGGEAVFELAAINFAGSDHVPVKGNTTYPVIGRDHDIARSEPSGSGLWRHFLGHSWQPCDGGGTVRLPFASCAPHG